MKIRPLRTSREPGRSVTPLPNAATESRVVHLAPEALRIDPTVDARDLFPFQVAGASWLRQNPRGLLADEMGLGKSVQALRSIETRGYAIIVCPASLRLNWLAEANRWRPDLAARVLLHLDRAFGLFTVPMPARGKGALNILAYDTLPEVHEIEQAYRDNATSLFSVFFDEAHYAKNPDAKRSQRTAALARACKSANALTGTPLLGRPLDLWGVLRAFDLARSTFGTWENFVRIFEGVQNKYNGWDFGTKIRGVKKRELTEKHFGPARRLLAPVMLRRTRAEVLPSLPPKIITELPVDIEGGSYSIGKAEAAWELYGAEKLPPFEMLSEARKALATAKIPAMLGVVEQFENEDIPLVVFSAHREPIDRLARREGWLTLTGDTTPNARDRAVKAFQAGTLKGLALTIQAGGVGLTLTRGSHMLFVDADYTPALNQQAEDRQVRIGQTAQSVQVIRLVANHPLDKRLTEILVGKRHVIRGVVGP